MTNQGLEKLRIWQESRELAKAVYRDVVPELPKTEQWGLSDQLRRAAVSVVANIAEGYGRHYFPERIRFSYIARGSLEELGTLLGLAGDLGVVRPEIVNGALQRVGRLRGELNGYIHYLREKSASHRGKSAV